MLKINFYPDSDLEDFSKDILEYEEIWIAEGGMVTEAWERITGLKFKETFINAIVFDNKSTSHALSLRYNYDKDIKKAVLVHELGHRILYKRIAGGAKKNTLQSHKMLFLVLYDLFVELYGVEFASKTVEWDSALSPDYKSAWEWALSFSMDERKEKFKEILKGGYYLT